MTCPHLANGHCLLAARLAEQELGIVIDCPTDEDNCRKCLSTGEPTPHNPSLNCLKTVRVNCPKERLGEWSAFVRFILHGTSRGLGDTVKKITRATGIDRIVEKVTRGGCGCPGRQKKWNKAAPYSPSQ